MESKKDNKDAIPDLDTTPTDGDAALSVPDAGEGGKLKMIVQLVKKSLGKDISAMWVQKTLCMFLWC
jgi:hypothetical protein